MKRSKKVKITVITILLFIGLGIFLYRENNAIETSYHTYSSNEIPDSFDGYTIVQLSDLHNKDFHGRLLEMIEAEDPDMVAVTGDVIDRNRTDIPIAIDLLEELTESTPVYFVSGNHEIASEQYDELKSELERIGVVNLDDHEGETISVEEEEIGLIGLEDPLLLLADEIARAGSVEQLLQQNIDEMVEEVSTDFTLLLSHRAELLQVYSETDVDLTLTGHAHGGQIRLPFVEGEGLYAPTQGFFPDYTQGMYEQSDTSMIVSRGLGNSFFPIRLFNRPELVVITLESE